MRVQNGKHKSGDVELSIQMKPGFYTITVDGEEFLFNESGERVPIKHSKETVVEKVKDVIAKIPKPPKIDEDE